MVASATFMAQLKQLEIFFRELHSTMSQMYANYIQVHKT